MFISDLVEEVDESLWCVPEFVGEDVYVGDSDEHDEQSKKFVSVFCVGVGGKGR